MPAQTIEDEILIQAGLKQQNVDVTEQINNLLASLSEIEKHRVLLQITDH